MTSSSSAPDPRYGSGPRRYEPQSAPTPAPTSRAQGQSYGPPDPKYPAPTPDPTPGYPSPGPTPTPDPTPGYPAPGPTPTPDPAPGYPAPPSAPGYPEPTPTPTPTPTPDPTPPAKKCPPSSDCDTEAIDDITCQAQADAARAEEWKASAEARARRQTAFDTTRGLYDVARVTAEAAAEKQKEVIAELLCQIHLNTDVTKRLDDAFGQVMDCIAECPDDSGCGVPDDCGFGGDWTTDRIADLRARVEKVEKYFDDVLVNEPKALGDNVQAVQKLIDDLTTAMKAEVKDPKRWYVQAREAEWARVRITGRFADQNEFQNCLCRGLICSLEGRRKLVELVGDKKYEECKEKARQDRCDWLRKNVVSETLATATLLEKKTAS
uniref:hypothetical protein n=1 Tax=Paractinoplanes polyasparticus TaxID=2856853 RepID=UPI001C848CC6|nr:hypothetical protein [Actinoplanes polyasparticus]